MKLTDKLSLKFSLKPLAFKLTYKRAKFVDKRGLTHYDFTQSMRLVRPKLRRPRVKRTDGTYLPLTCIIQDVLLVCGIAACNPFREECTTSFECCTWGLSNEQKLILSALVGGVVSHEDVYVVKENIGVCRCCGKEKDLRLDVCFDCADEVKAEELVDGVTVLSNRKGDVMDDLDDMHMRLKDEVHAMYKANPKSNGTRAASDKHTADCIRRMIVRIGFDVVHKKTGKLYTYIRDVIDCTNATDGRKMALYMNDKHELFVRERNEFHAKFEKVEV